MRKSTVKTTAAAPSSNTMKTRPPTVSDFPPEMIYQTIMAATKIPLEPITIPEPDLSTTVKNHTENENENNKKNNTTTVTTTTTTLNKDTLTEQNKNNNINIILNENNNSLNDSIRSSCLEENSLDLKIVNLDTDCILLSSDSISNNDQLASSSEKRLKSNAWDDKTPFTKTRLKALAMALSNDSDHLKTKNGTLCKKKLIQFIDEMGMRGTDNEIEWLFDTLTASTSVWKEPYKKFNQKKTIIESKEYNNNDTEIEDPSPQTSEGDQTSVSGPFKTIKQRKQSELEAQAQKFSAEDLQQAPLFRRRLAVSACPITSYLNPCLECDCQQFSCFGKQSTSKRRAFSRLYKSSQCAVCCHHCSYHGLQEEAVLYPRLDPLPVPQCFVTPIFFSCNPCTAAYCECSAFLCGFVSEWSESPQQPPESK